MKGKATLLLFFIPFFLNSQEIKKSLLPKIEKLSSKDPVFRQFSEAVKENDKNLAQSKELYMEFFRYSPKKNETLIQIASSTNIPYDTISTLNNLLSNSDLLYGKEIILPSCKGVFVNKNPENSVETILFAENKNLLENSKIVCYIINNKELYFLPGVRFSPSSRAFFLDDKIRMPLEKIRITSEFGLRQDPFTGKNSIHNGVDFACKEGTSVFSCKKGTVEYIKFNDETFGNYIIIRHTNQMTSVYAHLSKIFIKQGENVSLGQKIALSGKTGRVTGPHLHFEIRLDGKASNPLEKLKVKQ